MYQTAWESMAARYANQPYVVGADLRNEIRPDIRMSSRWVSGAPTPKLTFRIPTWGTGDGTMIMGDFAPYILNYTHPEIDKNPRLSDVLIWLKSLLIRSPVEIYDWHAAAQAVGNRIVTANPNMLVIVPGVFDLNSYIPNIMQLVFYGLKADGKLRNTIGRLIPIPDAITQYSQIQNLTGIRQRPVVLQQPRRLVYSAHLYPFYYDASQFTWNGTDPTYAEYSRLLDQYWGYIFQEDLAPVWIGETGNGASEQGLSSAWLNYTVRYLAQHDLDFAYWPIADSRPTIDWLGRFDPGKDDYALLNRTFNGLQYAPMYESFKSLIRPKRGPGVPKDKNHRQPIAEEQGLTVQTFIEE